MWSKLDDSFYDCPKVIAGGNTVAGAFARSLAYCGRHGTDGVIPEKVASLTLCEGKRTTLQGLLDTGLWTEHDEGYVIPDYLDYNPKAKQVKERRAATRARMQKLRGNKS